MNNGGLEMNTYQITLSDDYNKIVPAETPAKAKYELFRYLSDVCEWDDGFKGFLKNIISCKCLHKFNPSDLFRNDETFENTKKWRNLEFAYLGMNIEMDGKKGVIVCGNSSLNLNICFEGQCWEENCHPWYRMKYFDNKGNLIKEYLD